MSSSSSPTSPSQQRRSTTNVNISNGSIHNNDDDSNNMSSPPGSPMKAPPTLSTTSIEAKDQDVTSFVTDMLSQMELDFQQTGDSIRSRMLQMGQKMDNLEQSISDLMTDAGLEGNQHGDDDATAVISTPNNKSRASNKDTV
mmetsp:Transcript_24468/g.58022  ORF Transcript_24468/g.58022 Transcript_24468/m.58022 type:complete len:142 (+) Transcript_24468:387-812(+)|eukprot:CAMPEP_0113484410 /NCGR_PEP_ID=MMETSP0014_2-20120614/23947_1 /TAXON_ID=2857 /ORGANISM="Nitzschia sp." /LENGTH=141 /DNA_ID=CAMNT_0000378011 /DNA_START=222 /DNA_END=647 /DNA_ORIENTATION=- /assembly_acc=CAM_ASM_000159